jgi:hypothetical protein
VIRSGSPVDQKAAEAFPLSAQQQAANLKNTLSTEVSQVSASDLQTLQNLVSGQADAKVMQAWLTNHKDIVDTLTAFDTLMQPLETWQIKQQIIQQAADTKVAAHLLYAQALAKAGDPRARAQFDSAFKGFSQSDMSRYANDPDVVNTGNLVGINVNAGRNYFAPQRISF